MRKQKPVVIEWERFKHIEITPVEIEWEEWNEEPAWEIHFPKEPAPEPAWEIEWDVWDQEPAWTLEWWDEEE